MPPLLCALCARRMWKCGTLNSLSYKITGDFV